MVVNWSEPLTFAAVAVSMMLSSSVPSVSSSTVVSNWRIPAPERSEWTESWCLTGSWIVARQFLGWSPVASLEAVVV